MRFALKTLILAMMAMFIATLCMAQAAPKKGSFWIQSKVHAYMQMYSAKNERAGSTSAKADTSRIRLDDFELSAGWTYGPVLIKGAIRVDDQATNGLAYGDNYGQWNIIGPLYLKGGLYEVPALKSRNTKTYTVDSFAHATDRHGAIELGVSNLGGMLSVGIVAFAATDYKDQDTNLTAIQAYVDFSKKVGSMTLGANVGFSTNSELWGQSDVINDGGSRTVSSDIPALFAEISLDMDMGLHFMANMLMRLKSGPSGSESPLKSAFHVEAGFNAGKLYVGAQFDWLTPQVKEAGTYTYNKSNIGLAVTYAAHEAMTVKTDFNYGLAGLKSFTWRLGFEWELKKTWDI